jgi:hypothetical protein
VLDLDDLDGAVSQRIEVVEEVGDLRLEQELTFGKFRSGTIFTSKFDLADDPRRRVEDRSAGSNCQLLLRWAVHKEDFSRGADIPSPFTMI